MTTYKLSLSADRKKVSVRVGADAAPVGDTDLGTFVHDESTDPVDKVGANHTLFHHIRDILYKRKASNGAAGASYPAGIYNMQDISIVRYGPAINAEYLSAANVTRAGAGTVTAVVKYQPANVAADNNDFTWVSSVPAKATVSAAGVITYVAAGTTVITATHKQTGKSVSFNAVMT